MKIALKDLTKELKIKQLRLVEKQNLHVTMLFLGEINADMIENIKDILSQLDFKKFKISIEGLGVFLPERPHVLFAGIKEGNQELVNIYQKLYAKLKENGFYLESRQYVPHITLARMKWLDEESRVELFRFIATHKEKIGELYCNNVVLKKSVLTEEGPIYQNIFEKKLLT